MNKKTINIQINPIPDKNVTSATDTNHMENTERTKCILKKVGLYYAISFSLQSVISEPTKNDE